jgi:hypothetical protein
MSIDEPHRPPAVLPASIVGPSIARLAARTWVRYVVPLTLLSAVVLAPIVFVALRQPVAADPEGMRAQIAVAWIVAGVGWIPQLAIVAAVAPAVRAVAGGAPLGQLRAFVDGARSVIRAIVPCTIAAAAVLLGFAALVVPGFALLVLLATTGASERLGEPPPAPLVDAVAAARARRWVVAVIVGVMLAASLAVVAFVQWRLHLFAELPKKPPPGVAIASRELVRIVGFALVVVSPVPACALAAAYVKAR